MSIPQAEPARRRALRSPAAVALVACLLPAGCNSTEAGRSAAGPPSGTARGDGAAPGDWRNATYAMTCDGLSPAGFRATLHNGKARVPADVGQTPYYDYFDVRFEAQASGDVDGDGMPDTVVLLQCFPQPSNGFVEEAQVFTGPQARLGVLPSPSTLPETSILPPLYDPAGLSVDHGDILAAMKVYGPEDSQASGPTEHATVRWHWDGQRFVRVPL